MAAGLASAFEPIRQARPPLPYPSPFPLRTPSLLCAPPSLLIRPSFPFRPASILLRLWLFSLCNGSIYSIQYKGVRGGRA